MSRRRLTWLIHNALVTPFILIRIMLFAIYKLGELAEWIGMRTPGWRRYDGWSGFRNGEHLKDIDRLAGEVG